MNKLRQS